MAKDIRNYYSTLEAKRKALVTAGREDLDIEDVEDAFEDYILWMSRRGSGGKGDPGWRRYFETQYLRRRSRPAGVTKLSAEYWDQISQEIISGGGTFDEGYEAVASYSDEYYRRLERLKTLIDSQGKDGGPTKFLVLPHTRDYYDLAAKYFRTKRWERLMRAAETLFDTNYFRKFRTYVAALDAQYEYLANKDGVLKT